jgi:hypothetical protein
VRQTIYNDTLDKVNRAPGEGEPLGLGQAVSLFNGGLQVLQPGSRGYPLPGGGAVGVTLAYNSANARRDEVRFPDEGGQPVYKRLVPYESWVGFGWTLHLGRIFDVSSYVDDESGWKYASGPDGYEYFEEPSGARFSFFPTTEKAHPARRFTYYVDCINYVEPPPLPCCSDGKCEPDSPKCNPVTECTGRELDKDEHYIVREPDGTTIRLEKLVPAAEVGGWIRNTQRSGFCPVWLEDAYGNRVDVTYFRRSCPAEESLTEVQCEAKYPFPEAIRRITTPH